MSILGIVVGLVALERLAELVIARRNTRRLLAAGAVEHGARHYPALVTLHALWFLSILAFVPAGTPPNWLLLGIFAALQPLRVWVMASLGPFWTTRIIVLPGAPAVRHGPYRWLRHPNYLIVAAEIASLPLAFGAGRIALVFSVANAVLLWHRIRVEEAARGP